MFETENESATTKRNIIILLIGILIGGCLVSRIVSGIVDKITGRNQPPITATIEKSPNLTVIPLLKVTVAPAAGTAQNITFPTPLPTTPKSQVIENYRQQISLAVEAFKNSYLALKKDSAVFSQSSWREAVLTETAKIIEINDHFIQATAPTNSEKELADFKDLQTKAQKLSELAKRFQKMVEQQDLSLLKAIETDFIKSGIPLTF